MIQIEIILLTNNIVLPFQQLKQNYQLDFIELNKLFATKSLAEHGLGFLINVYEVQDSDNFTNLKLLKKIIFDTGGPNLTFLHNSDLRGYQFYDTDMIILSHWHYDHSGGLIKILERIEKEVPIICHESATFERFFRREKNLRIEDLEGKPREEILPLLLSSKIVNQEPIDLKKLKTLNGQVQFTRDPYEILNVDGLKIFVSGEIPRNHIEENFNNFFSLQEGTLKTDKILDDKCLILEFDENIVLLNGCCHSGLMNTLDYIKNYSGKPISHIIGGFHMAGASEKRIRVTIDYLNTLDLFNNTLYLFPIHCSGERFIKMVNNISSSGIKAFNTSVGTTFNF
jgi:7,8-dihydropterin-6-yl-methyl-4-(beta-D-ribofuranosyl)aminobenzene 5'-phosphate synthase